jgi:hypothetical protein
MCNRTGRLASSAVASANGVAALGLRGLASGVERVTRDWFRSRGLSTSVVVPLGGCEVLAHLLGKLDSVRVVCPTAGVDAAVVHYVPESYRQLRNCCRRWLGVRLTCQQSMG